MSRSLGSIRPKLRGRSKPSWPSTRGALPSLLVEHNLEEVMRSCRRLIVLNDGRVIGDGVPHEVMGNAVVREAYVGSGGAGHARH